MMVNAEHNLGRNTEVQKNIEYRKNAVNLQNIKIFFNQDFSAITLYTKFL